MKAAWGKIIWLTLLAVSTECAIVPPPWADPTKNPCAKQPRGWQLLYWPADGKCYKIYQIGAPCPETMELTPAADGEGTSPECKCPPGTAQSPRDALCHSIFTRASCPKGQYFAPVPENPGKPRSKQRWGVCREPEPCLKKGEIFWPRDGKCYARLSRGPCPKGELLTTTEDELAVCSCSSKGELGEYYWPNGSNKGCYEHYTKGPCTETSDLFLPGGVCGCHSGLPHYYALTKMCYPLGGIGPCSPGHQYILPDANKTSNVTAQCICKPGHVLYNDGICYRLFTRGPCESGSMIVSSTSCIPVPCKRGRLYFDTERTCYKIGSRGPCQAGQVVLYDYNARPSIDGISYNGVCGCPSESKTTEKCYEDTNKLNCDDIPGAVFLNKTCYKLYTKGPCADGEWLVPQRDPRNGRWQGSVSSPKAKCACRPYYKRISQSKESENSNFITSGGCQPPTVTLARFLNARIKAGGFNLS